MKKIILKYIVAPAAAFLAMAGCTDKSLPEKSGTVILKTQATGMDTADMTAYVFESGILREIIETVPSGTPGRYVFTPSEQSGTVYFISGASSVTALSSLSAGDTLDEFLETEASLEEFVSEEGIVMTGSGDLKDVAGGVLQVEMVRSVAVFDISVREAGVSVKNIEMKGIADRGFVNGRVPAESPESAVFNEISTAPDISAGETMLLSYVPEQKHEGGTIEVTAEIDGGIHVLKASIPAEISRGRHYSVEIHGNGTGASLTVRSDDWDMGGSSETEPSLRGLIDIEASVLPGGVRVNASCDTVFVSHSETSFRIASGVIHRTVGCGGRSGGRSHSRVKKLSCTGRGGGCKECLEASRQERCSNACRREQWRSAYRQDCDGVRAESCDGFRTSFP